MRWSEGKWPTVANVISVMVRAGWLVTTSAEHLETDGEIDYSYRVLGTRGQWTLAFEAAEGLVDEGALGRKDVGTLGKVVRGKYDTRILEWAMSDDAALAAAWNERFPDDKVPANGAVHDGWVVVYHIGEEEKWKQGLESRKAALDFCVEISSGFIGSLYRLIRPDGIVELDGIALKTAAWAHEANKEKND